MITITGPILRIFSIPMRFTAGLVLIGLFLAAGCTAGSQSPEVQGGAYYVDCQAGSDANPGTSPARPWGTLEKVNNFTLASGDGLFFKRGTRCAGTLWPKGSGQEGKPLTLAAYGRGSLPVIDGGKNEETFKLLDQQYWHIRDLEFTGGTLFGVLVSSSEPSDPRQGSETSDPRQGSETSDPRQGSETSDPRQGSETSDPRQGSETSGFGNLTTVRLRHFRLTNLVVHDVYGGEVKSKSSGLVIFLPGGEANAFDDVILDGITAYNTNQWAGISILGSNQYPYDPEKPGFGTDITVRNTTVHNVYGDGITLFSVQNGLIEYSVAYDTGQQPPPQTIGTPSSIWTWSCYDCTVQFNESYRAGSPTVDAGCYDIDWGTRNNLYQYNYGHDSAGYCLSVFGAGGLTTTNAVLRYNICANNGQRGDLALRQGDVFLSTWEGGRLDGIQIYNNTFSWNPPKRAPLLINHAAFTGSGKAIFANNLIYATESWFIESDKTLTFDHNLYWYSGAGQPLWFYGSDIYTSFSDFQRRTQQETNGLFADPKLADPTYHRVGKPTAAFMLQTGSPAIDVGMDLGNMGQRDFCGNPIPGGKTYDIGACEWLGKSSLNTPAGIAVGMLAPGFDLPAVNSRRLSLPSFYGSPLLLAFIDTQVAIFGDERNTSRSQVVFLKSLLAQFGSRGLRAALVPAGLSPEDALNLAYDWDLGSIPLLVGDRGVNLAQQYGAGRLPVTFLISADGRILQRWDGLALPSQLAASLMAVFGQP